MKREVHSAKENLDWTVRVRVIPAEIRPIGFRTIVKGTAGPPQYMDSNVDPGMGVPGPMGGATGTGIIGFVLLPLLFLLAVIPVMLVVLPLRYARVLPWRIEAIAYPWGRRSEALAMQWKVKGRKNDLQRVVDEIATALERGDNNPQIAGAVRDAAEDG